MGYLLNLLDGVNQGMIWGLLAIGVFLSFRVLDFADLTVEGSFTTGAATASVLITNGVSPWLATIVAILAGGAAGLITALLHTKLKIPPILAGILTMIGLYSINIAIMGGKSNIALIQSPTCFTQLRDAFGMIPENTRYAVLILAIVAVTASVAALYWYFGTSSGSAVRATGSNEKMCRAQGVNTDNTKIIGLVLSNALVGFAGALIAQQQGFSDVNMGVGAIVIGLASVIIGETIFGKARSFLPKLIAAVVGSIIYRIIITVCIMTNILDSSYLKLLTAVIVAIALSIPSIRKLCHAISVRMIARYPGYAKHCRLREEKKARNKVRADQRKAEQAEQKAAVQAAKTASKEEAQTAFKLEHPEEWAAQQQRRKEQEEIRRQRKELRLKNTAERQAEQKRKAIARAEARLEQLRSADEKAESALQAIRAAYRRTEDPTEREKLDAKLHAAEVKSEACKKLISEQNDTIVMLEQNADGSQINLKLVGVSKTFNAKTINEKQALTEVSLEIRQGDFVTVIGGNGAGKSTLLNMTSGVFEADAGRIFLDGVDVTRMPEHKRAKYLGRVFQDPMMGTAANMEIAENMALANRRGLVKGLGWAVTKDEREDFKEQLAELGLGLESRLTSKVGLLSGGQRQALTLLMATLVEPKLLLLDEHTAALDPKTAKKVLELTEKITSEKRLTTMMITHNMNDALRYGNRLIMMHEGRIIYDVRGEEKARLTVEDLLKKFEDVAGEALASDKMLLTD